MMTKEQLQEGLSYAEDNFKNEDASHLKVDKKLIREKFDLTGKNILDFGCGMGGMSLWYGTNWDCKVYGLDIDGHHIDIANRLKERHQVNNVTFEKRNILDDPFPEDLKFDYIFLNDVAEHIQFPILKEIFLHLEKILRKDGAIFVTYPPWRSPYASHVSHVVKIPWCQFLPQNMLLGMIEKNNRQIIGDLESDLVQAYKGLNHLTHHKLMDVLKVTKLKPVYRKSHCMLNKVPPLKNMNIRFFPLDFLVTKEFLLLKLA